jgi:hypothetical protein
MIIGIVLLLVCTGALILVWVRLAGIEVSGGLAEGLDFIMRGVLTIRFQILLSLVILVVGVGAGILLYEIRNFRLIKEFGAATCVVVALASGFFAIEFLV